MNLPELVISEKTASGLLAEFPLQGMLLVADSHNGPLAEASGFTVKVINSHHEIHFNDVDSSRFTGVIALGGCSALDVGRYIAGGRPFFGIPTILSTSCISVNISILRSRQEERMVKTVTPEKTIIPMGTILSTPRDELERYSASGLGDLLANMSASINYGYSHGDLSYERLRENAALAFDALGWIRDSFTAYDRPALVRLATYLHDSSLEVIRRGSPELSADFEHRFYETIIRQQRYSSTIQTHGFLVMPGTLMSVFVYEKHSEPRGLTEQLKKACCKAGIPASYGEFGKYGIAREHILEALGELRDGPSLVAHSLREEGTAFVDELLS
ncbi:MAG: iron-containing alcohol dehydrogenase [Candidatus Eremiobacteraeota bacterium]|nr:iron-containing alcohol dehydrogenase [Candidatus Eremiobacteraeota bacterium]